MLIERRLDGWEITVPAKLNLFLEVVRRRADGYHELDTIMTGISLCDRIRFSSTTNAAIELSVLPEGGEEFRKLTSDDQAWEVPTDASNLVVRALEAVRRHCGIAMGMKVRLFKGIPSQAGLGGGSADAAGAIVGGMLAWQGHYNPDLAGEIAANLGSDINFFLEGRTADKENESWLARCTGRGEIVEPIGSNRRSHFVVLHPPLGCSTKRIFQGLAEDWETRSEPARSPDELEEYVADMSTIFNGRLFNRLQKPASKENEWIARMIDKLNGSAAVLGTSMTGSGSAVFGMVETEAEARSLAKRFSQTLKVRAYAVSSWQTLPIADQLAAIRV